MSNVTHYMPIQINAKLSLNSRGQSVSVVIMLQEIVLSRRFSQLDYEGISSPTPEKGLAPSRQLLFCKSYLVFCPPRRSSFLFISRVIHPAFFLLQIALCLKLFVVHLPGRLHDYTRVRIQMSAEPKIILMKNAATDFCHP